MIVIWSVHAILKGAGVSNSCTIIAERRFFRYIVRTVYPPEDFAIPPHDFLDSVYHNLYINIDILLTKYVEFATMIITQRNGAIYVFWWKNKAAS